MRCPVAHSLWALCFSPLSVSFSLHHFCSHLFWFRPLAALQPAALVALLHLYLLSLLLPRRLRPLPPICAHSLRSVFGGHIAGLFSAHFVGYLLCRSLPPLPVPLPAAPSADSRRDVDLLSRPSSCSSSFSARATSPCLFPLRSTRPARTPCDTSTSAHRRARGPRPSTARLTCAEHPSTSS